MPKGISVQEAADRLADAGLRLRDRYERGTAGKGGRWVGAAAVASKNFKDGMSEFLAKGDLGKAMQEAGGGAYDEGVRNKGVLNWPTGMAAGAAKYTRKVGKFAALWNQPLPTPKGAKRSPNNIKRISENIDRFQKARGA